jgi:hypothetical protein
MCTGASCRRNSDGAAPRRRAARSGDVGAECSCLSPSVRYGTWAQARCVRALLAWRGALNPHAGLAPSPISRSPRMNSYKRIVRSIWTPSSGGSTGMLIKYLPKQKRREEKDPIRTRGTTCCEQALLPGTRAPAPIRSSYSPLAGRPVSSVRWALQPAK